VIRSLETKLAKWVSCVGVVCAKLEFTDVVVRFRTLRQHEDFQVNKADNAAQLQQLANVVDSIFHKAECDQMSGLRDTWSRPEEKKISASDTALTTGIAILHADTHPMVCWGKSSCLVVPCVCSHCWVWDQVMPNMSLHSLMRHGIGNMTILHYLGIIEQRAAEIINAFLAFRGTISEDVAWFVCCVVGH